MTIEFLHPGVFERAEATATRVAERWFRYRRAQAVRVKVDLSEVKIQLPHSLTVKQNTLAVWDNQPVKNASRRLISGYLR